MRFLIPCIAVFLVIQTSLSNPSPGGGDARSQTKGAQNITLKTEDGLDLVLSVSKRGVTGSLSYANTLANGTSAAKGSSTAGKGTAGSNAETSATDGGVAGALSFGASLGKRATASASYSASMGNSTRAGSVASAQSTPTAKPGKTNTKTTCSTTQKPRSCPKNEKWTDCDNNSCQRNCATFGLKNLACRPIPTPGCICSKGYLRNKKGQCVLPSCCENNVCPDQNEEYNACPSREPTCEDIFSGETPTEPTDPSSEPKCVCKAGFVRREDGLCVLPDDCCLDPNAIPQSCPYICPGNTCAHPETEDCGEPCREFPKGCVCKSGFTRLSLEDPKCVLIEECPVVEECTTPAPSPSYSDDQYTNNPQ